MAPINAVSALRKVQSTKLKQVRFRLSRAQLAKLRMEQKRELVQLEQALSKNRMTRAEQENSNVYGVKSPQKVGRTASSKSERLVDAYSHVRPIPAPSFDDVTKMAAHRRGAAAFRLNLARQLEGRDGKGRKVGELRKELADILKKNTGWTRSLYADIRRVLKMRNVSEEEISAVIKLRRTAMQLNEKIERLTRTQGSIGEVKELQEKSRVAWSEFNMGFISAFVLPPKLRKK